jgi:hypothetical protein
VAIATLLLRGRGRRNATTTGTPKTVAGEVADDEG